MSEPEPSRKMRIVAVAAAALAVALALVAIIVVIARGGAPAASANSAVLADHDVHVTDVIKLETARVDAVVDRGVPRGVRVADAELARALGLEPDDVVTAVSGTPMTGESDLHETVFQLGMMRAATVYVDIARGGKPLLVRWRLDGDLRQARQDAPRASAPMSPPPVPSVDPHPVLDLIEKVDDTHYRVPSATIDALLADPMMIAKAARVVPAFRNGAPDGFKLYAIRPGSVYARLGLQNGDTLRAINGFELTSPDKVLDLYTGLRGAASLTLDLWRRGRSVMLTVEITN